MSTQYTMSEEKQNEEKFTKRGLLEASNLLLQFLMTRLRQNEDNVWLGTRPDQPCRLHTGKC